MATKDEIKKVILDIAGNPTSGAIKDLADSWAEAIEALDKPAKSGTPSLPTKENRVTKPEETR